MKGPGRIFGKINENQMYNASIEWYMKTCIIILYYITQYIILFLFYRWKSDGTILESDRQVTSTSVHDDVDYDDDHDDSIADVYAVRNSIPQLHVPPNHQAPFTIPKTNSSPLKDGGWVSLLSFWQSLFSGAILGAIQLGTRKQGAPKRYIEHFMYTNYIN